MTIDLNNILTSEERPTYTAVEVGTREIKFESSKGGHKVFTKSWLKQMVKEGKATLNGDKLNFTGDIQREF